MKFILMIKAKSIGKMKNISMIKAKSIGKMKRVITLKYLASKFRVIFGKSYTE
jgi:hypothetical protein